MVGRMNGSPRHTILPGALLALLVTAGAGIALAVVIGVSRDAPDRLWLGGGDGAVSLDGRAGTAVVGAERRASAPAGLPLAAPVALLPGARPAGLAAATLRLPRATGDRAAAGRSRTRLRGSARVRRRADRRAPRRSRPTQSAPAPVATPAAATPPAAGAPAPASTVVRARGRGRSQTKAKVPKQRAGAPRAARPAPNAAPAPAAAPPGPPPRPDRAAPGPPPDKRPAGRPGPGNGVGHDDGVLERVPPGHARHP